MVIVAFGVMVLSGVGEALGARFRAGGFFTSNPTKRMKANVPASMRKICFILKS
jgi:hypothetical protein